MHRAENLMVTSVRLRDLLGNTKRWDSHERNVRLCCSKCPASEGTLLWGSIDDVVTNDHPSLFLSKLITENCDR
jgi:hypothetical protein